MHAPRHMNRSVTLALAVTASLLAARSATADTRSWTAVKKVIGKGDSIVIGIDLAQVRTTTAFQQGLQLFLSQEEEAKGVFDIIKSDCGFDITTTVSDITVVMQDDGDRPLIAFGLDGIDEARVVTCMGAVAGKMTGMPSPKLTGKKIGKITEYSVKGEKKKLYAAWLAKDVLVFTDDANDKAKLTKRLTGKGPLGDLKTFIGLSAPTAPLWFAVAKREKEDGRQILGGYGKAELAGGMIKLAGSVVFSKPDEATAFAAEGQQGLVDAKKEIAADPKLVEVGKAINTVTITASGNEGRIAGQVADKDIAKIVPQLDHLF